MKEGREKEGKGQRSQMRRLAFRLDGFGDEGEKESSFSSRRVSRRR